MPSTEPNIANINTSFAKPKVLPRRAKCSGVDSLVPGGSDRSKEYNSIPAAQANKTPLKSLVYVKSPFQSLGTSLE